MKLLILGHQLAGKTTLMKYMGEHTKLPLSEMDNEILNRNHGHWPRDKRVVSTVIVPDVMAGLLRCRRMIFFASYLSGSDIRRLKAAGYRMYVLEISREEITRRNAERIKTTGRDSASPWVVGQTKLIAESEAASLVDGYIDAEAPTPEVAAAIVRHYLA